MTAQSNNSYQIRPPFKDKFRPAEAKALIEKALGEIVLIYKSGTEIPNTGYDDEREKQESSDVTPKQAMAKAMSERIKNDLKRLKKDERYKYIVQVSVGESNGQGMRVGSRNFWDDDTDDMVVVSLQNDKIFVLVCAFAVYLY